MAFHELDGNANGPNSYRSAQHNPVESVDQTMTRDQETLQKQETSGPQAEHARKLKNA